MGKKGHVKKTEPIILNTQGHTFDYKELAKALVLAQKEAEDLREKEQEQLREKQQREWEGMLGQKVYTGGNRITRILHRWRNNIVAFFKIIFLSRNEARGDWATFGLVRSALLLLFEVIKLILYLITIGLIIAGFYSSEKKTFAFSLIPLMYAILAFMLGRLFRIAGFEIEKMNDRNYLLSILSAVTALIAMILALIALFAR